MEGDPLFHPPPSSLWDSRCEFFFSVLFISCALTFDAREKIIMNTHNHGNRFFGGILEPSIYIYIYFITIKVFTKLYADNSSILDSPEKTSFVYVMFSLLDIFSLILSVY